MKNYGDLRECLYLPRPTASMDNTLLDLYSSNKCCLEEKKDTQPHSLTVI